MINQSCGRITHCTYTHTHTSIIKQIVKLLLEYGADVGARAKGGACYACTDMDKATDARISMTRPHPPIQNHTVVQTHNPIYTYIQKSTHAGGTALHIACRVGQAGIAKLLLDKGADPRARCVFWFNMYDITSIVGLTQSSRRSTAASPHAPLIHNDTHSYDNSHHLHT